jgi:hypothetical protein
MFNRFCCRFCTNVWNVAASRQRCFTSCGEQCLRSISYHIQTHQQHRRTVTHREVHRAVLYCCTWPPTTSEWQLLASHHLVRFMGRAAVQLSYVAPTVPICHRWLEGLPESTHGLCFWTLLARRSLQCVQTYVRECCDIGLLFAAPSVL